VWQHPRVTAFEESLAAARAALADDPQEAYQAIRPLLELPGAVDETPRFVEAVGLFAEIARSIAGDALAASIAAAAESPDDPQRLYDAAYALYEQQLFPIAATLLSRANEIAPGLPMIVTELSSNLEAMMQYSTAARVIVRSGLAETDAMCGYLHAFNALMSGELEAARARLRQLDASTDPEMASMTGAIAAMLARADAVSSVGALDARQLTAWHAVINGTVLLHEANIGYDEGMHGRYAYLGDSAGLMREGIARLRAVIAESGKEIRRVVAAPDRASRILARAAAKVLELPLADWKRGADGLVVVWNLDAVGEAAFLDAMREHAPDQILFAHASAWVDPFPYAPDVTTVLEQQVTHPWTGGALRVDPETRAVTRAEADPRSDDELAELIVSAEITDPSRTSEADVLAVVRALAGLPEDQRAGLARSSGARVRQRAGSPVPSNRFT
jgi:tetratricopeptide (TPR) repeat protein